MVRVRNTAILTGLLALLLAGMPERAVAADAWFGVESLEKRIKRSENARARVADPEFGALSLRLPPDEDPYTAITGAEVYGYLQDIMNISVETRPEGERFWGRIAGSRSEVATAEYIADKFQEFGLKEVRLEDVKGGAQWWPLKWEATLLGSEAYGSGTTDVHFDSAFPALQLQGDPVAIEGLEAELAFVGYGQPVDLVGRDIEGKVAVVRAAMQSDGFFQTARGYMDGVIEAGAVGVLVIMDTPGNHQYALEDMGPGHVPALILGGDDGRFLLDAMAAAGSANPLKIRIGLMTEIRDSWLGKNVFGMVPGKSDEYVVIVSHLDGYFESANDNGGGLASMLALANYYANEAPEKPKRNMLFVGTSGHHEFSDGVATLIREHKETLDNSVLVMNIEHPSSTFSYYRGPLKFKRATVPGQIATTTTHGTRSLNVSNGNALLVDFYRQAIDRYGLVINAERELSPPTGDAFDLYRAGYVVAQILDANIWYHSTADRIDVIQETGMERATRLYADVLDQIDRHGTEELQERAKP
ncbi:MAG: M28 family peptidase [Gammaproteobacteria bacterium]|jgi:hypothetical protein|nr:M28 family peptidase [Gammaproteobacteria bacterium]MDP7093100.1 M28 family peptidase [Gammaproteobacteria bacterium]MDP7271927.1 M28 family peptidase [Gammaproteobacteria bacterium]HJP03579.1 M28 family peptidase [Gammaproteobacteria bacterium]